MTAVALTAPTTHFGIVFPSNAPFSDISAALPLGIQPTIPWAAPAPGVASVQNVDQAGRQFGTIFTAVARGEPVSRVGVDEAIIGIRSIAGANANDHL